MRNGHTIIGWVFGFLMFLASGFAQAAALKNVQNVGAPFPNKEEWVHVVYDFAVDGGAAGQYDMLVAQGSVLIKDMHCVVKTAATSGGSATIDVGTTTTEDYFLAGVAVAALTANSIHRVLLTEGTPNVHKVPVRLTDGQKVLLDIDVAALTAGKIDCAFSLMRD